MDYNGETAGDVLDLSALLDANYDVGDNVADFVRATQSGGSDVLVEVNLDGTGSDWEEVAILQGYYDTNNDILVRLEQSAAAQTIHPV
ncbi:MAG: type I secretion C-terminal target domain-containing protein [Xanthobacteraceae bacterium]|nr:type I secretion C-terminal target domain-containing protein [Xanthobacteraceae bacterium]